MNRIFEKKKSILLIVLACSVISPLFAQEERRNIFEEAKNNAYIILGTTAAGTILGLSSLSFSRNPSEDVDNIIVGGAIGIIVGVAVVTWKQLDNRQKLYDNGHVHKNHPGFDTTQRLSWHRLKHRRLVGARRPLNMGYSFSF